jgi:hypothetical protein
MVERGWGLRRGEVIGPRGKLFEHGTTTALYAAAPVYLPDDFAECAEGNRTIVLVWLVPITDDEAEYVRTHGWNSFEDALVAEDPDLTVVDRPPISVACLH